LRSFQGFFWACFLGWGVQYRLSQWIGPSLSHNQEWVGYAGLGFVSLSVSCFWSLAFIRRLWIKRPQSWQRSVLWAFGASFLIYMSTALTFVWMPLYAGALLAIPFMTLNVSGLAWALLVGTWQWRALQNSPVVAGATAAPTLLPAAEIASGAKEPAVVPREPAHVGLRTVEIAALVFAGLLFFLAVAGAFLWFFVVSRAAAYR
jgi:hypothetical protein